jgi:type VI secretion system protein ImpI
MTTCSSITDMFVNEQTERLTGNDFGSSAPAAPRKQRLDDPLAALDAMEEGPGPIDLYGGFEIEPNAHNKTQAYLLAEDQQWLGRTIESKADSEQEVGSAIVLKPSVINYGEYTMDEDILTKIEHEAEQASDKALPNKHIATGHITAAPMMRGLGVNLSSNSEDMAQMQEISEEIGASLAASIQGLLSLHKEVEDSRFNLLNKNLQPIEDNPLRLGLNYESTVKTLLTAEKSPVHLSAPSAIAESLAAVSHHNQAVQVATLDALRHLLKAFSPEVLEKRFESYRRPHQQKSGGASSWVWTMYQSYYEELTSNRQNGFEKLFWEVFDQAYDKSIRLIAAKD